MYRIIPYQLPLKAPLCLPGCEPLSQREGILIHHPETGGWGDAAPLPGFSSETVKDLLQTLKQPDPDFQKYPSLRFAVECAEKLFAPPEVDARVQALWIVEREPLRDLLLRLKDWENPVIKVKPGNPPRMDAVNELCRYRPDCRLRLDGNRQWSVAETLALFSKLPDGNLAYIEEPLSDPEQYGLLWKREKIPVALDESLLGPEGKALAENPEVKALVLKPTLLGNSADYAVWTELADTLHKEIVWSSCFESGVGLWHLARLAAGTGVAGLDTNAVFSGDLVSPRPLARRGKIMTGTEMLKVTVR